MTSLYDLELRRRGRVEKVEESGSLRDEKLVSCRVVVGLGFIFLRGLVEERRVIPAGLVLGLAWDDFGLDLALGFDLSLSSIVGSKKISSIDESSLDNSRVSGGMDSSWP